MAAGVVDGAIIVDTGIKNDKAKVGAKDFINMVEQMANTVNKVGQQMSGSVNGYIQAMNRARSAAKALTGDQAAVAKEILSTTSALKKLEERQELAQRKWEAAREDAIASAMQKYQDTWGGAELLPWETEEEAARNFEEELASVAEKAAEDFGSFEDTAAFRNMSAEIEFLTDKLEGLKAMLGDMQQQESQPAGDTADRAREAADSTREVVDNTREAGETANGASSAFQAFGSVVGRAAGGFVQLAGSAARAGASIVKIAGGGALSFLRKLAEGARNAAIQLAKLSGRAISGGFKTLGQGILAAGKWMLGLKSSTQQANGGFKRGLMTILKYGLGIRSLYFLFRKLRTAVTESFTELAKHDARTRNSINSLKTALAGLKGSLATAFSPIFNAVAPALTRLINMLTAAINAIGAFMAALTGQSTYQKAVAGLEDAGSAAGGAGDAASDAADDYKELKRELAGFDDLDILGSKDSSSGSGSSGGGGGGGGAGGGFTYETEEIGSGIVDFVAKLKEMWENADYEGIGRTIAGVINNAFETAKGLISWDNLGDKITEAVDAITGIFNGLVDGIDWTLIGETFGEGINTIIRTVNLLLTGIDWENLGKGFANGLNGLVDTVSWSELGQLFSNKLNALISTIKGVVSNFKWENAGTAFATTVNSLFEGVSWDDLIEAGKNGVNGIAAALRTAVNSFSWDYAATAFVNVVNGLMTGINWDDLVDAAKAGINGIISAMRTTVTGFKWDYAGTAFVNIVNGLLTGIDWDGMADTAKAGINGIISILRTTVTGFSWDYAATSFVNSVNGLLTGIDWDGLADTAKTGINKLISSMRTVVTGFSWDYAATSFVNSVNSLLTGIKWDDLVDAATKGLNRIISSMRTIVTGFNWDYAGTNFGNMVNSLFSGDTRVDWTALGETAAAAIGGPLTALKNAVSTFSFGDAAQAFADTVNGFFSNEQLWADAGETVSTAIKGLFTWGTDFLNGLDIDQIAEDVRKALETVDWPGIAESIWNFLGSALDKLGKLIWKIILGSNTNSAEFVHEGEEQLNDILREFNIEPIELDFRFGLDVTNPQENEWFIELQQAIQDSLRAGEWIIPLDPSIPPEAVELARQEFVYQWNKKHPEAPIDLEPELPTDTPEKIKGALKKITPTPTVDVDPKLTDTPAPGSATLSSVFGSWFKVLAYLGGVDPDSKRYTSLIAGSTGTLFPYWFKVLAYLGGVDPDSKRYTSLVNGSTGTLFPYWFKVLAYLGGVDPDSKRYTSLVKGNTGTLFAYWFKVLAYLGGKDPDSKRYTPLEKGNTGTIFASYFKVLAYLSGKDSDSKSLSTIFDTVLDVVADLTGKKKGTKSVSDVIDNTLSVVITAISLAKGVLDDLKKKIKDAVDSAAKSAGKAKGGAITNSGREIDFASGGVIRGGMARYLANVPHYAGGTTRAHGTVFVAGESGPEIMGHINGRTEILNKSQLAQAIYSAVVAGMGQAVNALGTFLAGQMAACTNAITGTIGNMSAIRSLEYHAPVMATGSVMPYEVSAQIARTGEDIQDTLNSNNEDLIQTIISVAGQIVAAMQMSGRNNAEGDGQGGLTVQQVIRQINQRTQMFGGSPLLG